MKFPFRSLPRAPRPRISAAGNRGASYTYSGPPASIHANTPQDESERQSLIAQGNLDPQTSLADARQEVAGTAASGPGQDFQSLGNPPPQAWRDVFPNGPGDPGSHEPSPTDSYLAAAEAADTADEALSNAGNLSLETPASASALNSGGGFLGDHPPQFSLDSTAPNPGNFDFTSAPAVSVDDGGGEGGAADEGD